MVNAVAVGDKVNMQDQGPQLHSQTGLPCSPSREPDNRGSPWLQLPGEVKFNYFDAEGNMQEISVDELTKGKKVAMHG